MTKIIVNKGQTNQFDYDVTDCANGTDKQNDYADSIKAKIIGEIIMIVGQPGGNDRKDQVVKYADLLNAKTDAIFWINNKSNSWKEIVKSIM